MKTPSTLPRALRLVSMTAALVSALPSLAVAAAPGGEHEYARGRILVEAQPGLSDEELDKVLKIHGGKREKVGQSHLHVVRLPANASEKAVVALLSKRPELKFVELDRKVKSTFTVTDPYFGSEWHLAKVGAPLAWDTTRGANITIAILDSGVDTAHPDLAPNLVAGYNSYSNNTDVSDVCGHGTAVAGTAAARLNNAVGVAGVAGEARIMPIRIAYLDATNGCYAYFSTVANGLTWAADHGARIANISYGGLAGSAAVQSAANYMKSKGGLVFVSAGNDGTNNTVAPTTSMITVSATDSNDVKTSWSTYGNVVSLASPGAGIWTTSKGGTYGAWQGTSFASPLAAGVGALVMSARPDLTSAQIESLLYSSALDLGSAGRDPYYGHGRVNAAGAVGAAASYVNLADTAAPTASVLSPLGSSSVSGLVAVAASAADNVGVARVELRVNGTTVAVDSAAPFSFSWNSTGVPNGMANLTAVAFDAAGNGGTSATVAVNVANVVAVVVADTIAPSVIITNPVAGSVSGTVTVNVSASDNSGAAGVSQTLFIDGAIRASGTGGTLAYSWNSRKMPAGLHTITAVAKDRAGNSRTTTVQVSSR